MNVRTPLFDRLVDRDPQPEPHLQRELRPMRTLDRRGLKKSVRRELEQLFNTRCPVAQHHLLGRQRSVIDYGIPDLAIFSARSHDDRLRIAEILRQAIVAYEPRLIDPRVVVEQVPGEELALMARIEARMITDTVPEPVLFLSVLQLKEGEVSVHEE
ncbi:MAG TPA: type VI secretion system baseplate subunit TssE [Thermoanaerobaculia bacterium]|nr:type VI secretion system baseplate subunit TssE [Thermoanaerobaculia bacterium]